jgi:hypothetical protein
LKIVSSAVFSACGPGVPAAIVPDQLKSGVTDSCRYEPGIQRTYEEMAGHYGTVILPARPARPRDKAKVEVAVQIAQRWILARLRNQTFFSLAALIERIAELLADPPRQDPSTLLAIEGANDYFESHRNHMDYSRAAKSAVACAAAVGCCAMPAAQASHAAVTSPRIPITARIPPCRLPGRIPVPASAVSFRR